MEPTRINNPVYMRFRHGKVAYIRELVRGEVIADFDAGGNLLGLHILTPSKKLAMLMTDDIDVPDDIGPSKAPWWHLPWEQLDWLTVAARAVVAITSMALITGVAVMLWNMPRDLFMVIVVIPTIACLVSWSLHRTIHNSIWRDDDV